MGYYEGGCVHLVDHHSTAQGTDLSWDQGVSITVGSGRLLMRCGELPTIYKTNKLFKTYLASVCIHWCPEARVAS